MKTCLVRHAHKLSTTKRKLSILTRTSIITASLWIDRCKGISMVPGQTNSLLPSAVPANPSHTGQFTSSSPNEEQMTRDCLEIVDQAIMAVDPYRAVKNHFFAEEETSTLRVGSGEIDLSRYDELVLVAFGKASSAMATAVLQQLQIKGEKLLLPACSGVVICKDDHATEDELAALKKYSVSCYPASHPVPDERSSQASSALLDVVKSRAAPNTLVVCCISGGGSSLFCNPASGLTMDHLQQVNSVLLASGMGIQDMNIIRKRLEKGKGGRLAALCHPSQLVSLVLSDVLGDPLDLIASGPTVPDTSSWEDAWEVVQRYDLEEKLPEAVLEILRRGSQGSLPDSPSSEHPIFATSKTVLVGNNSLAVQAAAKQAKELGYHPVVLGTQIEGEAKEIAHFYSGMALHLQKQNPALSSSFCLAPTLPAALIAGGETTVSLTNDSGKGGRNQELALAAAVQLNDLGLRNVVLASAGTDGTDGPTDAAGAVVDATTVSDTMALAREALAKHDVYPYLDQLGESRPGLPAPLIKTGPTGTNVADICVTLVGEKPYV